ncbi:winged helix-turn-helix transcriptional regulator [Paenibacillus cellulositrophicus]|uniref:winged helix-turn-helix transcriptional regulator n=1 Tax=Paenibacillus cellulositrophicus TaxID=562959 RepID=UPI00203D0032|nr:helix-turn-helix domain-containing protein [Paenibacillus cellulositrophicus]MCM2997896.1 helix-turn-helix transcriptional regulator [Paenibacillus cellulositrophicus]
MKKNPEYGVLRAEYLQGCSVEVALNIIGGKWKGMILYTLLDGTKRFNELRQIIPGITQRMLTLQLRELEDCGIVQRVVYPEVPPRVEYSLTEFGNTIKPVILQIREWGSSYKKAMGGHLKQSNSN